MHRGRCPASECCPCTLDPREQTRNQLVRLPWFCCKGSRQFPSNKEQSIYFPDQMLWTDPCKSVQYFWYSEYYPSWSRRGDHSQSYAGSYSQKGRPHRRKWRRIALSGTWSHWFRILHKLPGYRFLLQRYPGHPGPDIRPSCRQLPFRRRKSLSLNCRKILRL